MNPHATTEFGMRTQRFCSANVAQRWRCQPYEGPSSGLGPSRTKIIDRTMSRSRGSRWTVRAEINVAATAAFWAPEIASKSALIAVGNGSPALCSLQASRPAVTQFRSAVGSKLVATSASQIRAATIGVASTGDARVRPRLAAYTQRGTRLVSVTAAALMSSCQRSRAAGMSVHVFGRANASIAGPSSHLDCAAPWRSHCGSRSRSTQYSFLSLNPRASSSSLAIDCKGVFMM